MKPIVWRFVSALLTLACMTQAWSADMRSAIQQAVQSNALGGATIGICVIDATTSETLVDINSERPQKPASCNKLFTTAAGLSLLGPEFRFITELMTTGTISNGTLRGTLIVRGGGDPTISGRFEADKRDVTGIMKRWAAELQSKGIRKIEGGLVADSSYFDNDCFHNAWYPGERGEWYEAEVWGLSFNDNCVDLSWSGKDRLPQEPASFTMNPANSYASVVNQVQVIAKGRTAERYYKREELSNQINATGSISVDSTREDSASIHDGPMYFLTVFRDVLTSAGIEVNGGLSHAGHDVKQATPAPTMLLRHESPPLREVVNVINRNSQNFYAECLIKTLGREKAGKGSFAAGTDVAMKFVRESGVFSEGQVMVDGSGLAGLNRTTPRQLAELVRMMDKGPYAAAWRDSLPIGGSRGTLKSRFQETTASKAVAGRIMGKTGLIGGVRTLTGIARNKADHDCYYSIMLNDFTASSDQVISFIDRMAVEIASGE